MDEVGKAIYFLNKGSVIVHATEGVFGLAARAFDYNACKLVWKIKKRPFDKKFIVIFSSIDEILEYASVDAMNKEKIYQTWPGHTTWILESTFNCPEFVK